MAGNHLVPSWLLALCLPALWLITSCTPPPAQTGVAEAPPASAPPAPHARSGSHGSESGARCVQAGDTSCLHAMAPAATGSVPPGSGVAQPVAPGPMRAYLLSVLRDLDRTWVAWFKDNGMGEPEVYYTLILAGESHPSHCRSPRTSKRISVEHDHPNAYYCRVDPYDPGDPASPRGTSDSDNGMIILPVTTLQRLWGGAGRVAGPAGDFAVAVVLAHEFGHHVQDEVAIHWFEDSSVPVPVFTGANSELIADCLAGAWVSTRYPREALGPAAIDAAFAAVTAMGAPQSAAGYGSGHERRDAFLRGAAGSRPGECIAAYWR